MKPFTEAAIEAFFEDAHWSGEDRINAQLLQDGVCQTRTDTGWCYGKVLRPFIPTQHELLVSPRHQAGHSRGFQLTVRPNSTKSVQERIKKIFDVLYYTRMLDRQHVEISYSDEGYATMRLLKNIDYISAYMALCFYRLVEANPHPAEGLIRLYLAGRKKRIKFLQCFLYFARKYNLGSAHFFFPEFYRANFQMSPAFGHALWKTIQLHRDDRKKLLGCRDDGLVYSILTKFHDAVSPDGIRYVSDSKDILHPALGPIFVNSKLTKEKYDKVLKQFPGQMETMVYDTDYNKYGDLY